VQCCIQMNRDYKLDYLFQNLGRRTVIIFTDKFSRILPPGCETVMEMPSTDSPWMADFDELKEESPNYYCHNGFPVLIAQAV